MCTNELLPDGKAFLLVSSASAVTGHPGGTIKLVALSSKWFGGDSVGESTDFCTMEILAIVSVCDGKAVGKSVGRDVRFGLLCGALVLGVGPLLGVCVVGYVMSRLVCLSRIEKYRFRIAMLQSFALT